MADVENIPPPTVTRGEVEGKKTGKEANKNKEGSGRKLLQTINNQKLLVGSDGQLRLSSSSPKPIKIYQDPPASSTPDKPASSRTLKSTPVQATVAQTTTETQVEERDTAQARAELEMYGAEEDLPLEYWRDLAEKRREALETSLHENEDLHNSLSLLEEENDKIKEEMEVLRSQAEQAEELAKILNSVCEDEPASDDEEHVDGDEEHADGDQSAGDATDKDASDEASASEPSS